MSLVTRYIITLIIGGWRMVHLALLMRTAAGALTTLNTGPPSRPCHFLQGHACCKASRPSTYNDSLLPRLAST